MSKQNCLSCGTLTRRTIDGAPYCRECQKSFSEQRIIQIKMDQKKKEQDERQKALTKAVFDKVGNEPAVTCPSCGQQMEKKACPEENVLTGDEFIVIDKCPNCKAVFLDNGELSKVIEIIKEEAESNDDGGSSFSTGLIVGMAINN